MSRDAPPPVALQPRGATAANRDAPELFPAAAPAPVRPPRRFGRAPAAPAAPPAAGTRVVAVLPTVVGIDRTFDYTVPAALDASVRLGTVVRVDLGGRRVGGWVVADQTVADQTVAGEGVAGEGAVESRRALRPLRAVTGWGPAPELIDLAGWAAWRWAGRRAHLLGAASPPGAVPVLPAPDRRPPAVPPDPGELAGVVDEAMARRHAVVRLPPAADLTLLVALVARAGPTLVVLPSSARAAVLAGRLRRAGAGVALVPGEGAAARAGAGVVVGARAAAWAPVADLAAVVVLDAHDEALVQGQSPSWWAGTVAAERAARAGVPCLQVSPCPTLDLLAAAPTVRPSVAFERRGWPVVEVVDRRDDDPRLGLYSERLVRALRDAASAVCVLNRTGRARLLVCGACGQTAACERCGAAVVLGEGRTLTCLRCGTTRPAVCAACDSARLRQLRPGVAKVREELESLVGRPVGEVTAGSAATVDTAVTVGTEAVLHRAAAADLVAFLDFDQELLAPRLRAGEEALALLARAARLVGGRQRSGRVLVQTRSPGHDVLAAAVGADPSRLSGPEAELRRALRLPPATALARVSGPGAAELVGALDREGIDTVPEGDDRWLLRAASAAVLCDALAGAPRPERRVRVEVDPVRA